MLKLPICLDPSVPFAQAADLDVIIPVDDEGHVDVFINDGITISVDIDDKVDRGCNAMPLAIHLLCHPLATDEPILCDDRLSISS